MNQLRKILNMKEPVKKIDDHELFAKQFTRQMSIMGYESYDVWCVAEKMLDYSLNPQDNSDLFTPYQRVTRKRYPST